MDIIRTIAELTPKLAEYRQDNQSIAYVPTMGNLHLGHIELVKTALQRADRAVVSIFINPHQFNQQQDFDKYPRTENDDLRKLTTIGADIAFIPSINEVYPADGVEEIKAGHLADGLCGDFRPKHFDGVVTVLARLFQIVSPDIAVFGRKDYQQLCIVRELVDTLRLNIRIVDIPTVRTPQGLALSSRNTRLTAAQKRKAPLLYHTLCDCATALKAEADLTTVLQKARASLTAAEFQPEYIEVRKGNTLEKTASVYDRPLVILVAAWLGEIRLIDNIIIE